MMFGGAKCFWWLHRGTYEVAQSKQAAESGYVFNKLQTRMNCHISRRVWGYVCSECRNVGSCQGWIRGSKWNPVVVVPRLPNVFPRSELGPCY